MTLSQVQRAFSQLSEPIARINGLASRGLLTAPPSALQRLHRCSEELTLALQEAGLQRGQRDEVPRDLERAWQVFRTAWRELLVLQAAPSTRRTRL